MSNKYLYVPLAIVALLLAGAGCVRGPVAGGGGQSPQTAAVKFSADDKSVKEFIITAKSWAFEPNVITIKKGDKVRLKITSVDVTHGFMLKDYNINVELPPGETKIVEFIADKAGTFGFRCSVPCGDGHQDMLGTLVVE